MTRRDRSVKGMKIPGLVFVSLLLSAFAVGYETGQNGWGLVLVALVFVVPLVCLTALYAWWNGELENGK